VVAELTARQKRRKNGNRLSRKQERKKIKHQRPLKQIRASTVKQGQTKAKHGD
jgi:hypothetical protein